MPTLTLEELVGQVIVAVWPGDPEALAGLVALGRVGGLLVAPGVAPREGALAEALGRLQRLATYPLLCLAGAEHALGPFVPGAQALAAARRPDLARRAGALAAAEARVRGIGLVLAPPFDVPREPARQAPGALGFGDNPSLVARLGAAFVEGCQAAGALAVGHAFPGRGAAVCDAESRLSVLPQDRSTLEKIDLLPYVEACRAGLGAIMTGHLHVPALDSLPNRLATHSSVVVEGLLRRTLQFQGLLLSDNLDAPEVQARYGPAEAAVLAFAAGHDLLITESPAAVYRALYEVLLHGDVPRSRLQEAVGRIWAARSWLGLAAEPGRARLDASRVPLARCGTGPADGPPGDETSELQQGPDLAREVARAALVAVRGRPDLVAAPPRLVVTHRCARPGDSPLEEALSRLAPGRLGAVACHVLATRPTPSQLDEIIAAASTAGAALLFLDLSRDERGRSRHREAIAALAQALRRAGLPVGVAVMGHPHALARFRDADLLLYAPGDAEPYLEAICAYLRGEIEPTGRLPVHVPGLE